MNNIKQHIEELVKFQTAFGAPCNTKLTLLSEDQIKLRVDMYDEEAEEFLKFFRLNNKVEILDAIADELFLLFGDIVSVGLGDLFTDKLDNYITYRSQMGEAMQEYLQQYKQYAPKIITLESLSASLGMLDLTDKNAEMNSMEGAELEMLEELLSQYFYHRLVLLEIKGAILYGSNYPDILDKALTTVWESNMSKLDENLQPIINGENGVLDKEKPLGKILKSERYWTPTEKLEAILVEYAIG